MRYDFMNFSGLLPALRYVVLDCGERFASRTPEWGRATELGASKLCFMTSSYSTDLHSRVRLLALRAFHWTREMKRKPKWAAIGREAAKQARRTTIAVTPSRRRK